eukprot:scaffold51574_cov51-Phaeocystis_antarctica.AAC.1
MVSPSHRAAADPERGETDHAARAPPSHAASPEAEPRSRPTSPPRERCGRDRRHAEKDISTLQRSALLPSLLQNLLQKRG